MKNESRAHTVTRVMLACAIAGVVGASFVPYVKAYSTEKNYALPDREYKRAVELCYNYAKREVMQYRQENPDVIDYVETKERFKYITNKCLRNEIRYYYENLINKERFKNKQLKDLRALASF